MTEVSRHWGAVFKNYLTVIELLIAGGADPGAGTPSAVENARFFQRHEALQLMTET